MLGSVAPLLLLGAASLLAGNALLETESWMNTAGEGTSRGREVAVSMRVVHPAMAAGQVLFAMPAGEHPSPTRHALATLRVCVGAVPVGLYTVRAPELESTPSLSLRALGRVAPLGLGTALGAGAIGGAVYGMGPVFAMQTTVPRWRCLHPRDPGRPGRAGLPAPAGALAAAEFDPRTEEEEVPAKETHGFR